MMNATTDPTPASVLAPAPAATTESASAADADTNADAHQYYTPMDSSVQERLNLFCLFHGIRQNRPMVLVSSGGTAADLEVNTVRSLENFATGLRGAQAVEQFVQRGYAVIHLQRIGSASPYGHVLSEVLGIKQGNYGITAHALDRLFDDHGTCNNDYVDNDLDLDPFHRNEQEEQEKIVKQVTEDDPWMTNVRATDRNKMENSKANPNKSKSTNSRNNYNCNSNTNSSPTDASATDGHTHHAPLELHYRLRQFPDQDLIRAIRSWRTLGKTRIFTISFRTVEEYLQRLQECAILMNTTCQSMAMFYLTAAVSDYYVPNKVLHKMQSSDSSLPSPSSIRTTATASITSTTAATSDKQQHQQQSLVLTLTPVPKVLGLLRTQWAPHAFVVSFKLETDPTILRSKAERAVSQYGVHMVVGNVLGTHYDVVHVLHRKEDYNYDGTNDDDDDDDYDDDADTTNGNVTQESMLSKHWTMTTITRPTSSSFYSSSMSSLESELIEFCVLHHFAYLAQRQFENVNTPSSIPSRLDLARSALDQYNETKRQQRRQEYWQRISDFMLQIGGTLLGMGMSFMISQAIQKRLGGGGRI